MPPAPARPRARVVNGRPLIMGRRGAVASQHPLATQVGIDVLRAGGNAADAAVAIAFALGVVEPQMSGLGGDGFYHVLEARTGRSIVINASGAAPMAATRERLLGESGGIPRIGPLSISVPGALGGLSALHAMHGSRPWARLMAPAIDLAESGFAATHVYRVLATSARNRLRADPHAVGTYLDRGAVPKLGASIRQPALAGTLRTIAAEGAETFYRGALARQIADAIAAAGGIITVDDLAACRPEMQAPVVGSFRGFEVRQTPPNSMGFAMLQLLGVLERLDLAGLPLDGPDLIHLLFEARKRVFADRDRHAGDPRWAAVPLERLLDPGTLADHAAAIDRERAAAFAVEPEAEESDTSYFCVVDRDGNAISGIQSLCLSFGAGVVAGDTGVLMSNRMSRFHVDDGHPNGVAPGKRVRQTMCAPLLMRDNELVCVFGSPGGDNQVMFQVQLLLAMIDHGLDPQAAVERPRIVGMPGGAPGMPAILGLEQPAADGTVGELTRRGHRVRLLGERGGSGSVSVIHRTPASGLLMAASDPRMDGWAAAW